MLQLKIRRLRSEVLAWVHLDLLLWHIKISPILMGLFQFFPNCIGLVKKAAKTLEAENRKKFSSWLCLESYVLARLWTPPGSQGSYSSLIWPACKCCCLSYHLPSGAIKVFKKGKWVEGREVLIRFFPLWTSRNTCLLQKNEKTWGSQKGGKTSLKSPHPEYSPLVS
jgi:hypothetical protein